MPTVAHTKPFVKRPADELLVELLSYRSAQEVHRHLTQQGYVISRAACERVRNRIIAARVAASRVDSRRIAVPIADPARNAEKGSAALEDAICALYGRTAKRLGCRLETAALLLNYSPEQLRKAAA